MFTFHVPALHCYILGLIFSVENSKQILLFVKAAAHLFYYIKFFQKIFYLQQEEKAKHASLVNSCCYL